MNSVDNAAISLPIIPKAAEFKPKKVSLLEEHERFKACNWSLWSRLETKRRDVRTEREFLMGFLMRSVDAKTATENAKKLINDHISYRDLCMITSEDLESYGYSSATERAAMLQSFQRLINQDAPLEYIYNSPVSHTYNNLIIEQATKYLKALRSIYASTNYKIQIDPPEDTVIDGKYYASRYAVKTMDSIKLVTNELINELGDMEKEIKQLKLNEQNKQNSLKKKNKLLWNFFYLSVFTIGTIFTVWLWSQDANSIKEISSTLNKTLPLKFPFI